MEGFFVHWNEPRGQMVKGGEMDFMDGDWLNISLLLCCTVMVRVS